MVNLSLNSEGEPCSTTNVPRSQSGTYYLVNSDSSPQESRNF